MKKNTKGLRRQAKKEAGKIVLDYMKNNSKEVVGASIDLLCRQNLKTRIATAWIILKGKKRLMKNENY